MKVMIRQFFFLRIIILFGFKKRIINACLYVCDKANFFFLFHSFYIITSCITFRIFTEKLLMIQNEINQAHNCKLLLLAR